MKPISELGLELIELDDQVLLVDNINVSESPYVLWNNKIYSNKIHSFTGVKYEECKRVISSTKQLDNIPLLVIEDEVEKLAINSFGHKPSKEDNDILLSLGKGYIGGFKEGYNKAKSRFKFTEEDLRKAIDASKHGFTDDYIINYLTKKELFIEVDVMNKGYTDESDKPYQECYIPKITNNKIKAKYK